MTDLDHLLHDWAARQEPTPVELNSLQTRIVEQTALVGRTDVSVRPTASSWIAIVAVAMSLQAAITVLWPGRRVNSMQSMDLASLPVGDMAARQSLFSELDRMFDGRWRWLSEVNGRVHLQTDEPADSATEMSSDANPGIAVRMTIVQRRSGDTTWRVVWEASVLARSEEWVRLPTEFMGDSAVSVWAYSLPDGSVLVESDVALTSPVAVRVSEQQVFRTSLRPTRLWSAHGPEGEFQLIQSVARMESHHG